MHGIGKWVSMVLHREIRLTEVRTATKDKTEETVGFDHAESRPGTIFMRLGNQRRWICDKTELGGWILEL